MHMAMTAIPHSLEFSIEGSIYALAVACQIHPQRKSFHLCAVIRERPDLTARDRTTKFCHPERGPPRRTKSKDLRLLNASHNAVILSDQSEV
jgi:hypothetical protein